MNKTKIKKGLGEVDQFYGKVIQVGNSKAIIIPNNNITYSGLKVGSKLKVWYRLED